MKPAIKALALIMLLGAMIPAQTKNTAVETELRGFFESYGDDLRSHRREAIGNRYDRRGVWLLGNGGKQLIPFENNRKYYLEKWTGPKSFSWKDLSFEVIGPTAAVAVGQFEWQAETDPASTVCSYSGLLIKTSGQWRLRVEDESCPPPKK